MGVTDLPLLQVDGKEIIIDAYASKVYISPSNILKQEYSQFKKQEGILHDQFESEYQLDACTLDGEHIMLLLNAGLEVSTELSNAHFCDGVGLYRTEAWFMQKSQFPTQLEQENWYQRSTL